MKLTNNLQLKLLNYFVSAATFACMVLTFKFIYAASSQRKPSAASDTPTSYLCISMIVLEVRILSYYFTILTISINFSCNQFFLVDLLGRCIHPGTGEANQQLAA